MYMYMYMYMYIRVYIPPHAHTLTYTGVGKHRQKWLPSQISGTGVAILSGVKKTVDPNNIFGNGTRDIGVCTRGCACL